MMTVRRFNSLLLLALLTVSGSSSRKVVGRAGEDVTLPCKYDIKSIGPTAVCWGRGSIPTSGCNNQIISTDGYKVTTRASSRYQLLGRLEDGDVSLTILKTTEEDAGRYGCRVEIAGWWGNDEKHHIDLTIEKAPSTSSTPTTETTEQTTNTSAAAGGPGRWQRSCGCGVCSARVDHFGHSERRSEKCNSSALELHRRGSAVRNIYQTDCYSEAVYESVSQLVIMMTVRRFNSLLLLALLTVSGSSSRKVVGRAGEDVTLPCKYDIKSNGPTAACWNRGSISDILCNNQIISTACWNLGLITDYICNKKIIYTDGSKVTTRASSRYQLLGQLEDGDVSLTILKTTEEDAGRYGCRVQIAGWFNDEKHYIDLTIEKAPSTSSTPTNETTERTPQTEQTINTSGQVTATTSSTSIDSEQQQQEEEKGKNQTDIIILVCVLLVLIALVAAGVAVSRRRWNQHKIPQQQQQQQQQQEQQEQQEEPELMYSLIQLSSDPPAVELQNQGPAVENIYQIDNDGGGNSDCVYEVCP
ncbi:T-cell immunoglobulin and mucin domain-containing protein 4-like [Scomber scombrus]